MASSHEPRRLKAGKKPRRLTSCLVSALVGYLSASEIRLWLQAAKTNAPSSNKPHVPGSGTVLTVSAVKVNRGAGCPLEFVEVNDHSPGVEAKPCPEIVPVPVISKKLAFCT